MGLGAGQVVWLVTALALSVTVALGLLIAVGAAEARSRQGEAEQVAAIRHRLIEERSTREAGVR